MITVKLLKESQLALLTAPGATGAEELLLAAVGFSHRTVDDWKNYNFNDHPYTDSNLDEQISFITFPLHCAMRTIKEKTKNDVKTMKLQQHRLPIV